MTEYETIAIFKTNCDPNLIETLSEKISTACAKKPGKFIEKKDWGVKKLAYEIENEKQGQYFSWKFSDNPESPSAVDKLLRFEEDVLRFVTFRTNDPVRKVKRSRKDKTEDSKKNVKIDFRNPISLAKYLTEKGKIVPRRVTGVDAYTQRVVSREIKRARQIALLSFTSGFSGGGHSDVPYEKSHDKFSRGEKR